MSTIVCSENNVPCRVSKRADGAPTCKQQQPSDFNMPRSEPKACNLHRQTDILSYTLRSISPRFFHSSESQLRHDEKRFHFNCQHRCKPPLCSYRDECVAPKGSVVPGLSLCQSIVKRCQDGSADSRWWSGSCSLWPGNFTVRCSDRFDVLNGTFWSILSVGFCISRPAGFHFRKATRVSL